MGRTAGRAAPRVGRARPKAPREHRGSVFRLQVRRPGSRPLLLLQNNRAAAWPLAFKAVSMG